jgi:murein L,D-transpeptidase YcbB/YkuD
MLTKADYAAAAARRGAPGSHGNAMASVESSGITFWDMPDGTRRPPVRFEAHRFGALTGYRFNASHPDLSSREWNPALAATTRAGAWAQVEAAEKLDKAAALAASSWGAFQVMGENWKGLKYPDVYALVAGNGTEAGQLDCFARYIEADPALRASLAIGAWSDVALRYNGSGQVAVYAAKLSAAVDHFAGNPDATPRPLRLGDSGPDVAKLQAALGLPVDGEYGPQTLAAVRLFQSAHGLLADGVAGAMTLAALAAA